MDSSKTSLLHYSEMGDHPNSSAFMKLKPLCVSFIRDCSIENINKLEYAVKELDSDSVELLQEFIVLPFIVHLNAKLSEKLTIKCIDFLTLIFKKGKVKAWNFFVNIFSLLLPKISNLRDMNTVSNTSEELKLSICESILSLIQCSTEEILNEMYSLSFRPHLAHAFFVLNIMLKEEKSKSLIKAVLRTMGGLTYNKDYIGKKYEVTELIASEALASCLPGLSIALQKIICGDNKQAHSIIIMGLNILTELLILTIGDESYERGIAKDSSSEVHCFAYKSGKLSAIKEPNSCERIPVVLKDETWFKSVSEKLEIILKSVTAVTSHDHWKVRLEFLKCAESLLLRCNKTLQNCISFLLSSVFGLSVDNNAIVSSTAKDTLISLSKKLDSLSYSTLNETVEDNIEKLIAQLIKFKFSANDSKKLSTLKSLLGYIDISSSSLDKLVFSATHLERIILTLITLLEFNTSEINLVEEVPVTENFDVTNLSWPKKRFKFFENEEILNTICRICYSLRYIGNSRALIDYLLEKLSSNNLYTLQCIFVIGSVIKGLSEESDASEKYSTLISDVLEIFLSSSLFDAPLHNSNIQEQVKPSLDVAVPNNILNKNKMQICLLLESIANCSECLGTNFKVHLKRVLCLVMEKAGSSNYIISQCGRLCLYRMAQFCKYKSVQELIKDNADYITNVILINFHQYLHKPEIAVVLRVAMEQSDAEAIVLFRELIFQILEFLDYNQDKAYPLMHVLFSVVVCIKKWFPCKGDLVNKTSIKSITHESLSMSVKNYIILKKTVIDLEPEIGEEFTTESPHDSELENSEKESTLNIDDNYDVDENKADVPLHVHIICEIFKRCVHLQSSENPYVRMLTLETVELCILVLRDHENQLLPLVHEFWSPFLRRFTEDTFAVKAINVLIAIANECGDFIRNRTLKDVMPRFVSFLQRESSKSFLKCNFKQYQWTSDHSLQVLLLSEIGNLCTKLDIDDKEVNAVASVCLPYLKNEQPKVLQDAAIKSLKSLATIDPDALWFYWNVSYSKENVLIPPHDDLCKLSFPFASNSSTSVTIDL